MKTYTQVRLASKSNETTKRYKWIRQTVWVPTSYIKTTHSLKIKDKIWLIFEIYSSMRAELVEKYPKDFKVVIPDET